MSVILGIDPGSKITGWAKIDTEKNYPLLIDMGAFELGGRKSIQEDPERLVILHAKMFSLLGQNLPEKIVIERGFIGKNRLTGYVLGQVMGAIITAFPGLDKRFYSPREIKLSVTGSGAADKETVKAMVSSQVLVKCTDGNRVPLSEIPNDQPQDAYDALAAALCCWDREGGK